MRASLIPDSGVRNLPCDSVTLRRRVSGAEGLKSSQAYPRPYAGAVRDAWMSAEPWPFDIDESSDEDVPWDIWEVASRKCEWRELDFQDMADMLHIPSHAPVA